jgi:hypothetical protein
VNFDAFIASLLPARENTAKNSSSKRSRISGARHIGEALQRGGTTRRHREQNPDNATESHGRNSPVQAVAARKR